MPKQSSIDSFFGANKKKQATLGSFFKKSKDKEKTAAKAEDDNKDPAKDNDGDVKMAIVNANVNDDKTKKRPKSSSPTKGSVSSKRRRQAIMDDDSDDDNDGDGMKNVNKVKNEKKTTTTTTTEKTLDRKPKEAKKDTTTSSKELSTKKNKEEKMKKEPSAVTVTPPQSDKKVDETDDDDDGVNDPQREMLLQRAKILIKSAGVEKKLENLSSPVMYKDLIAALEQIEAITGRLEIQAILTKFFRRILQSSPKDIYPAVYLASNSVAPAYECVELGIGDSILIKAIGEAYGTKAATVKQNYEKEGDLGTVAKTCKSKQRTLSFGMKPKPLTVAHVLQVFREIAKISGSKSQQLKVDKIKKLLVRTQESAETKYIIRGLQGKLRIGLAQSTVLISLAHAFSFTVPKTVKCNKEDGDDTTKTTTEKKEENDNIAVYEDASAPIEKRLEGAVNIVKQVYSEVPSYDALLDAALAVPLTELQDKCSFQPGIPVAPMLAKPTKSIQEVLKRLDGVSFTCEFKYDGERAQIHKTDDGKLKVFSRNLLETSAKYPELPLFVEEAASDDVTSFVLDAEVVAFNPKTGQLVPFQVLSTRKRTEESAATAKVQVIVQAFDLMYLNGQSLLNVSLRQRRELLLKHFSPVEGKFQYAKSLDFVEDGDTTALEQFLDTAVKGQCEGLMVKTMDDVYEPSRRSLNWLKLKKDYLEGLGDSFDLVPLGAYYGRGKRTGVYGAYLLACYDEDGEEFQSVCKIGTGFSDEDLQTLSAALNEHKIDSKSSQYNVADGLECDVWFDAVQVWEIKAADLSKSSLHRGAVGKTGEAGRGIGLRFPRYERTRDDKKPEQATTSDQILDFYYNQDTVKGQQQENNGDDDDDDDDGI